MSDWDFEFIFDPHDELMGMTHEQWCRLHDKKVRVRLIELEDMPIDSEEKDIE